MDHIATAAVVLAGISLTAGLFLLLVLIFLGFLALLAYWFLAVIWRPRKKLPLTLRRHANNPVLRPIASHWWESEAVFNPGAFVANGRVHLLYRAMGGDGVSRIGYASSPDGIHFDERPANPVYDQGSGFTPTTSQIDLRYRPLSYDTDAHASGGGWGGTEDPRAVMIDDRVYMSFGIFQSWQSIQMAFTSLSQEDLAMYRWAWEPYVTMSPKQETNKNWVIFPQKINGKYAVLHAMTPSIQIEYVDSLQDLQNNPIHSNGHRAGRPGYWDAFVRGAAAPPMHTPYGWLLLYHGMNPDDPKRVGYKVGAMLLDLQDPTKILFRSENPILEPTEWYENEWKQGVVYASGAVIFEDDLIVYYGGGDKYIGAAKANLDDFLHKMMTNKDVPLKKVEV